MAPTVLRCTPHDAHLLDRTGIIIASVPSQRPTDPALDDGCEPVVRHRVHRSSLASAAATALMAIVAIGAVVNPHVPVGGDVAREMAGGTGGQPAPTVVMQPPARTEQPTRPAAPPPVPQPAPEGEAVPGPDSQIAVLTGVTGRAVPTPESVTESPHPSPVPAALHEISRTTFTPIADTHAQVRDLLGTVHELRAHPAQADAVPGNGLTPPGLGDRFVPPGRVNF